MSNFAADDTQAIARRLRGLEAEKNEALTGTSAPVTGQEQKTEDPPSWGYGGSIDYCALKSAAHPNWPYAGTGFEWRKFVRS